MHVTMLRLLHPVTGSAGKAAMILLAVLSACGDPPTAEDRAELVGIWQPEDGSTQTVEFKPDGVFDYRYFATLRLDWELVRKGEVRLVTVDGSVTLTCHYTIEGDRLRIDNGSGETCVSPGVTPPEPMPLAFRKSP